MRIARSALALAFGCGLCTMSASAQDLRWADLPRLPFESPSAPTPAEEQPSPVVPPPPPLFTPETSARDTPPIFLHFANNRTLENARAVYEYQEDKLKAINEMTWLLQQVAKERTR